MGETEVPTDTFLHFLRSTNPPMLSAVRLPLVSLFFVGLFLASPAAAQSGDEAAQSGDEEAPQDGAAGGDASPEEGEEEQAPVLVAPVLTDFVEAEYPAEAAAEGLTATVDLILTIDIEGNVSEASVAAPVGNGFDEAALAAGRQFRFSPATSDGEPIPARIRYRYVFEMTIAEPDPPPPDEPEVPDPGALEGRVLDVDGDVAIEGAEVIVTSPDESVAQRAVTGEDGAFSFTDLPPGTYSLRVVTEEHGEQTQNEEVSENEVTAVVYRMTILDAGDDEDVFGATAVIDPPPREVTRRVIRREELTRIPGTRGDALRAVELLPGVARPPFGGGAVIIRGSAPNDSQVFLDSTPVPLLYHFGGLTSFINSRLLQQIDFVPGNFSARYGRKIGGILEVITRDPATDGFHGVAEFGVIDMSLMAEFPVTENFSMAMGVRRSLIDVVFSQVIPADLFTITAAPAYYDYQLFTTWTPTDRDRVRFNFYGSQDRFEIVIDDALGDDPGIQGDLGITTRFNIFQLAWKRQINAQWDMNLELSGGPIQLEFGLGDELGFDALFVQFQGRAEVNGQVHERIKLRMGMDIQYTPFTLDFVGPPVRQQEGTPDDGPLSAEELTYFSATDRAYRPSAYVEAEVAAHGGVKIIGGVRLDYYREIEAFTINPRLSVLWNVTDDFRLKFGLGQYSQPPEFQESAEGLGNPNLTPIHSVHSTIGFDWQVADGIRFGVDGFYKYLWDRVVGTPGGIDPVFTNQGIGRIYGAEISGKIDPVGRNFFGYLSYTVSRSERRDLPGQEFRLFDFDQTHIFTLAMVYKLPRGWEVGGTLRLVSGNPTTPVTGGLLNANDGTFFPFNGAVNSIRNPLFNRLDLRVQKTWQFDAWKLAFFLDIQNVYNRANQEAILYNYDYSESVPVPGLPIIPAIGIRGEL